jgi:saccharopine dehydrogenase-like NADP-dependent oxidoreductase
MPSMVTLRTGRSPAGRGRCGKTWERNRAVLELSQEPVTVDGLPVAPKRLLDALLYPHVRLDEGERDITVLRVETLGRKEGRRRKLKIDMVDRYDDGLGFTSMARTTAFTGAIVARLVARSEINATGLLPPEQVLTGRLFDRLLEELAALNLHFDLMEEKVQTLDSGEME